MRNHSPLPSLAWNKINQCRPSLRFCSLVSLSAFALLGTQATHSQTRTWDGSGVGDNWDTISNWDNNALPETTADVVFGTAFTSGTSIDTIASRTVNSLTINTVTGFSVGNAADTLTLTSGILNRNDVAGVEGNHTISSPITLGANGLWTIAGAVASPPALPLLTEPPPFPSLKQDWDRSS